MSISSEQLGFGKGEALPPPVLQPPAKYPLPDYKPIPFEFNTEISYLLAIKRDYAEFVRESPYSVQSVVIKKDIERYSDRYQDLVSDKIGYEERYDWNRMPQELKPAVRKRKTGKGVKEVAKKKKEIDINKKLQELEQKEDTQTSDVEEDEKNEEDGEDKDADEVPEEEEEVDEEMDDGTDYVNNYFDNGEGFDEEEDNLDDGPVY